MLVTFKTDAYANITMFGDVAVELLRMMGHSGTVPSAINPEDIPAALERLEAALAAREPEPAETAARDDEDQLGGRRVSLRNRAYPLVELMKAAHREQVPVMWES